MLQTPSRSPSYLPIAQLNTYCPNWSIKAKIVGRTNLQTFTKNSGGEGKIFSADLADVDGDVIRAKFWDSAAERWSCILEKDKIFTFRNGRINVANKRFNTLPHSYEITFDANADITECDAMAEDALVAEEIKSGRRSEGSAWRRKATDLRFDFISLRVIKNLKRDVPFIVDILGVVRSYRDVEQVTSKRNGESLFRRRLVVADRSEHEIEVTLWGEHAQLPNESFDNHPVIALRNVQIREWRGRNASSISSTVIVLENGEKKSALKSDHLREALALLQWYQQNESEVRFQSLTDASAAPNSLLQSTPGRMNEPLPIRANLEAIASEIEDLGEGESKLYITVAQPAKFFYANRNGEYVFLYNACSKCRKKVADDNRCEPCNQYVDPVPRYMAALSLVDETRGRFVVRGFHEGIATLVSASPSVVQSWVHRKDEIIENINDDNDPVKKPLTGADKIAQMFDYESTWELCKFKLRVRRERYNDVVRTNITVVHLAKVDYSELGESYMEEIVKFLPLGRKTLTADISKKMISSHPPPITSGPPEAKRVQSASTSALAKEAEGDLVGANFTPPQATQENSASQDKNLFLEEESISPMQITSENCLPASAKVEEEESSTPMQITSENCLPASAKVEVDAMEALSMNCDCAEDEK